MIGFIYGNFFALLPTECEGCGHLTDKGCETLANPMVQHTRLGGCAMRTHNRSKAQVDDFKLNPLKQSKRSMDKKK